MKRIIRWLISSFVLLQMMIGTIPVGLAGADSSVLTLMVYVTGSDLETSGGAATMDISEMLRGSLPGSDPPSLKGALLSRFGSDSPGLKGALGCKFFGGYGKRR